MAELFRYAAFISYSSKDAAFARRLHRALEGYGIPSSLGKFDLIGGGKKNRIYPVFRDREELSAGRLGERIEANLKASAALVVVCSLNAAASPWVQKEIEFFVGIGRGDKVFAIIAADAPVTDAAGGDATVACFPTPFRDDALADHSAFEPLAADARKGKDGFRKAWLKIVAGMIGVMPGRLVDRDRQRRRQQSILASAVAAALVFSATASMAWVDTQTWRTRFAAYADNLAGSRRPLDALSFALAAEPVGEALLSARSDRTDGILRRVGGTRIVREIGSSYRPYGRRFAGRFSLADVQISADQNVLAAIWQDGATISYDLSTGAARGVGHIDFPAGYHLLSADGGALVSLDDRLSSGILHDFAHHRRFDLGDVNGYSNYHLLGDGHYMLATRSDGHTVILDLGGPELMIGDLGAPALTHATLDGRGLLVIGADRHVSFFQLESTPKQTNLGVISYPVRLLASRDGRSVVASDGAGHAVHFDLSGVGTRHDLGQFVEELGSDDALNELRLSSDGTTLIAASYTGGLKLINLATGDIRVTPINLGQNPTTIVLSGDGLTVVAEENFGTSARAFDLSGRRAPTDLGVLHWRLSLDGSASGDGESIFGMDADTGRGFLLDMHNGARLVNLGEVGDLRDTALSANGATLSVVDSKGNRTLYDLTDRPGASNNAGGATLARAVCASSGEAIRPFARPLRMPTNGETRLMTSEARSIYLSLRGRPWNPCDWRGLAAGPEGWLQWLRLVQIRYFGARDYHCGEVDAAGHTSPSRLDACGMAVVREAAAALAR